MRTVVPVPRGGHLPLRTAQLFLLCVSLEVFATPTRRYHGRMLIHPSPPACATPVYQRVMTHTHIRDPRESAAACLGHALGTPSPWPSQVFMIKERCWFSQINFFIEYFPHRINIVFLSSQFYVIHIHR